MSYTIAEEKRVIRDRIRALRQSLAPERVLEAGEAVARIVRSHETAGKTGPVCVYAHTGKEIPTGTIINNLLAEGTVVAVPDWEAWKQGSGLKIVTITGTDELKTEGRVVPQPVVPEERSVPIDEIRLFLVPGIAFDLSGNRLGMGGGYFDRLLSQASSKTTIFGLAYEFQIVAHLPSDIHDIPVHNVVTPAGFRCGRTEHKEEDKCYGSRK